MEALFRVPVGTAGVYLGEAQSLHAVKGCICVRASVRVVRIVLRM